MDKAKEIAEKQFGVSECAVREKEAFREQVRADFEKAQLDFDRYQRLYEEDHAVSTNTFELQESRFKQASAAMKHADALVELSRQQLDQARSNLAIANKDASDSRVKAPISGLVFKRHKEPGEMAEMGKPIIEIYDDSAMEISAFLPQELYTRVIPGETHVQVRAGGIDMGELSVSFKSPSIDLRLRNFELKTRIAPPPAGVVPGALAEIKVILDRREGLGVPTRCIQNRAGSTVVFIAEDETARMVPVSLGFETGGYTEVSGEGIFEGVSVVTMGQNLLDDRDSVIPHEKESL